MPVVLTRRTPCLSISLRALLATFAIALIFSPYSLSAQRGGGRGSHPIPGGNQKSEPGESDELRDFNRSFALQATPDQADLFRQLVKDTTAAVAKTENLRQHPERMKEDASILAYVVESARDSNHDFLSGLTHPQKSGLKVWRKNVEKADSDVGRIWKAMSKDLSEENNDPQRIAADNDKLQKALNKSLEEQWALAEKMSIERPHQTTDAATPGRTE